MSTLCLIIGESGSGKSTAIRTLDPKKTFLITALNKPLPFIGWKKNYVPITKENPSGNFLVSDDHEIIIKTIKHVGENRKEINCLIVDDFQYIICNEFMRKHAATSKGNAVFQLFNDLADHVWNIIMDAQYCRENLVIIFLSHSDTNDMGKTKCKTIGKLLDEKVTLEGMFTVCLESFVKDGKYGFLTQNNGHNTAKSPMGMFKDLEIENDLDMVVKAIEKYNN